MIQKATACLLWGRLGAARALTWLLLAVRVGNSPAQVVLDGKFGTSGALSGPNYTITAGMGATRGNNLFQSFSQFDLKAGDVATFTGPAIIQNILARVTGGGPSSIDGTIRSGIAGANFFLINPHGIMFGPNAALDISGSFAASTADYLKLADGARFVASLGADDSGLSTAPVSAFGFLGNNPGAIAVQQSTLNCAKAISLVGGDIAVEGGSVQSPGGQINVVSVQSAGEVPVDPPKQSVAGFNTAFPQQGKITLQDAAQVDASGEGGGLIVIRGGSLVVDNSTIQANTTGATAGQGIDIAVVSDLDLLNGGQINSLSTMGLGNAGNINLTAQSIRLDGGGFPAMSQISTATGDQFLGGGPAKGGDIVIHTGSLELANNAQISSATFGAGNAGRIDISASSVRVDAMLTTFAQITANSMPFDQQNAGNAGDIAIHTGTLDLLNGGTISSTTYGSGNAGVVDINAQSVSLVIGGTIGVGTYGAGNGGNIRLTADSMRIDGGGIQAVTTSSDTPAPGGSILVTVGSLSLIHMGSIFTTSMAFSMGSSSGPGGNIEINAGNLSLSGGSTIRGESQGTGVAGNIALRVDGNIELADNSAVSTSAPYSSGGEIHVRAGSEILLTDSQITAQAGRNGGNISLDAPALIYLLRSTVTGEADKTASGHGNGGNLTIDPSFLILNQGGLISKSSFGNGGNISIFSDYFFQSASFIDASAPFGLPGTVTVTAPEVDLSGSLIGLPGNFLDLGAQLRPDCGVRLSGNVSSFIVLGRGGLPIAPSGFVPSSY